MKAAAARAPRRRRRTGAALVVLGLWALWIALDQLGIRQLSGDDFPPADPLGQAERAMVERLAAPAWGGRVPGTDGNRAAADFLVEAMSAAGLVPLPSLGGFRQRLGAAPELGDNLVGWLPADAPETAPTILLGAHFDHVGATGEGVLLGADDNASGVAVVRGAVPSIAAQRPRPANVVVVLFNTEEAPYFGTPRQGSRAFAAQLPPEIGGLDRVQLALVLDLVGGVVWRHSAQSIFACGAEKAPGLGAVVDGVREQGLDVRRLGIHMVENIPGHRPSAFSDYDVFRDRGVPFLFLSSGRTPRYHRPTDLPPTLHYDRMARTSRWIAALTARVAAAPRLAFDAAGEDLATDRAVTLWFLDAAVVPWRTPPGTGPLTWARLVGDRSRVRGGDADAPSLERAGFRVQCLLYAYPVCFTL